ncbi:transporter substrate-binding protein [Planktothrix agardhii]|uniref:transporter substrate-binding protein n=1 Tax=Planktothrix agardhii TaxID=1160 RepID=UPI002B20BF75|nr:transporter substrate-binding protein [Planktothrix agardhii]MEA5559858.1 transporter substrate-binding protein [Planktothrix agardhii UHCC 0887]
MSGVRVGLLHSLSGAMAYRERPLLETELMTIAQINDQGGVLGQIIEPVIEDGASDCFTFEQKAQKLIQQDGVTTLFGCWTTASRHAVRPVLEAFNAQLWYPASYEGLENCSQIFYTGFCANQQVELTINWLLRNQKTRCYLLGWDQVFSYTLNKLMKVHLKHYGGEVVGEAYLPSSTMDFEAIITRIRQAQPDIIINTLRGDRNLSFYRQFYESGIKASDLPILATSLSESEVQKLQEAAVGHFSCFHYFQSLNTPENHQFVQVFKRFYGEERVINNSMATAHTQIHLWKQAVELAESFDVERVKIAAYGQCFVSPGGLVRLEPNHHVAKVCRIGQVLPNQEFEVLYTSEKLIKPLPWLGFNEDNFNASGIVFELLSEVSQGIERAEQLEQKSIELEATKAQLQQEIETRKQFELALQKANEQLEKKVAERTAALKESNDNLVQEIVQHQRSENALRMATDQLQTVLEAVPGTVSWIDSDLCYIEVNQRLSNMLNLPRERFVGQHIGFLGTSSEFQDFVQDLFNSPEIDAYREVRNQVNGEWRHYLIVAQKYNDNQAAFVVGIDITERREAEAALRLSQDQLEAVLDVVPGTVSWISSDLRYLGVNRYLASTFDLQPEDFVNQDIGFLKASFEFNDFVRNFFDYPEKDSYQEVMSVIQGKPRNYLIVAHKYNQNQAAFFVGIDITERKQAEEALKQAEANYRSIFENAVEGIFQTTPTGIYLSANPALARIYGYQSPEELIQNITNIQDQLYVQPQRRQQFVKLLAEQGAIVGFESQIRRLDGQLTWISENAFAVRDEAGNLLHYEGTVEDINERKQAEAALQRAMEQLEIRVEERTAALREANHQLVREVAERTRIENALRESEAELRALFAAMTDVITVFDSEGRYKKIVTTNSEVLYSPTEELLGKTVFEVFPASHATLFYNQIQEVLNTKQTLNIEYSLVSAEYKPGHPGTNSSPLNPGDEVWFAAMVSPMPDNCVIWVARNTTERRRVLEALQAEREKSERLLLNILPPSIAEQLKQNQHSIAERFEQATIMFADIVDFTGFSARISPSELVNFLNQVFSAFDELAEKHHLEKIKTIGDSYMVAGGLPTPRHDHVEAMAEMALDMQAEIRRFQGQMGQSCNLRIGINTGPVVAGVIGTKKFIYDLWGDAVNIASRMESQGEVGKIQVTATTKNLLNGKYDFEERGLIDVKGRGEMLTYWLTKRRLV